MILDYQTFPSGKQYVCIRDGPKRIFLRNILFVRHPENPQQIAVVHEWGKKTDKGMWEPPKGQMEWKELASAGMKAGQSITPKALKSAMQDGVLRELSEEAKIAPRDLRGLTLLPLSYSHPFPKAGEGAEFRYQFWTATLTDAGLHRAQARMAAIVDHPEIWDSLPADKKEKDAVAWWRPTQARNAWSHIRGAFSHTMTSMYYAYGIPMMDAMADAAAKK